MKRIRLDKEVYEEGSVFSLTVVSANREPFFLDNELVATCLEDLRAAMRRYDAEICAYCFMPDHLHLLVAVPPADSLVEFVRHFKQLSSYQFRRLRGYDSQSLWQRRFYDHALRETEAVEKVADYIWDNPVRAGLVADRYDYLHWGSFVWDVSPVSGSKDPDLRGRGPPIRRTVGAGLQTRARSMSNNV